MIIRVERSGGLVGTYISHEIDSKDLPLAIKLKVKRIMTNIESRSSGLKSTPKGAADHFDYKISFQDGQNQRTINCNQYTIQEDLKSLVRYMEAKSKSTKGN
jgi:emfourin